MKSIHTLLPALAALVIAAPGTRAADVIKANNTDALNLGSSWVGGVAPTAADVAVWNSTVTGVNATALGDNLAWRGIRIANPAEVITINNTANFLTNGAAGLHMAAATVDFGFNPNLVLGADQTWDIAGGRTLNLWTVNTSRGASGSGNWTWANSAGGGEAVVNLLPGATGSVGYNDANANRDFTGDWVVGPGVLLKNIRNGRTAWGTDNAIRLAGGTIAPWQGNWTWTTPIVAAAGASSTIDNKNTGGSNRYLKLQGELSGAGALTFADTGLGMNSENLGYILTGSNTLSGTVNITATAKVRVGGVGGDSAATGAGPGGSLGTAAIVNDGLLTFTRSDALTVPNHISGGGTIRFGNPNVAGGGGQIVTLTGNNSWTGAAQLQTGAVVFATSAAVPASLGFFNVPFGTVAGVGFPVSQSFLDRLDTFSGGTLAMGASSSGALNFSGQFGTLSLGSLGTNTFSGALTPSSLDGGFTYNYRLGGAGGTLIVNSPLADYGGTPTGLILCGGGTGGTVILNATNTFTGPVTILGGVVIDATGFGFGAGNLNLGLYQGNGVFNRALGSGPNQVRVVAGDSGFSTFGGPLAVNLGGAGAPVAFDSPDFAPTALVLNAQQADGPLSFVNQLDLAGGIREIRVAATNPLATATLAGNVLNSAGFGGLTKSGAGTLVLAGHNTFAGELQLAGGTVSVASDANLGTGAFDALNFNGGILRVTGAALTSLGARVVYWGSFNGGFDIADPANTFTVNDQMFGGGGLVKNGPGLLVLGGDNQRTGATVINDGVLRLAHANALAGSPVTLNVNHGLDIAGLDPSLGGLVGPGAVDFGARTVTLTPTANRTYSGAVSGAGRIVLDAPATGSFQIFSGTNAFPFSGAYEIANSLFIFNGSSSLAGQPALEISAAPDDFASGIVLGEAFDGQAATFSRLSGGGAIRSDWGPVGGSPRTLAINQSVDTTFAGVISLDQAQNLRQINLEKLGSGKLTLSGNNSYRGTTTIGGGTLALAGAGSINNSIAIEVGDGATLDVSGLATLPFVLGAAQTLQGGGAVKGDLLAEGTVAPGASIGTLTVQGAVTLAGATAMELGKNGITTSDKLAVTGTLTYGGDLGVRHLGPAPLAAGDRFVLFSAAARLGSFANISLPDLGPGLAWTNRLASDGSIEVLATVPTTPPPIQFGVVEGQLLVGWPAEYTGWQLQTQTNSLSVGISGLWYPWPGSTTTNAVAVPIDPANPSVFLRLVHPPQP